MVKMMKIYQVWFQTGIQSRAPSDVFLDEDYSWAGEMEASSPKDLVRRLAEVDPKESELLDHKMPSTGDVLLEDNGTGWILTPLGVWAVVNIFREENSSVDE